MSAFFLACAAVSAIPMLIQRDPMSALVLAINPIFWTVCARLS